MSWLDGVRHRLRALLRPGAHERELQEEMRFHLELDVMHEGDADVARRRFGNRTYWQEETRRMTWLGYLDGLTQDARYAWRSLARTPGVALMIVLTLSLGVGVNAATFTLLDRLYLRPPSGIEDPSSLRRIWFRSSGARMADGQPYVHAAANYPMYRAVADANGDPRTIALYYPDVALRFGSGEGPSRVSGVFASASYFSVLGVRPALGRLYTTEEDSLGRGSRVAVVSDRFWRVALGADSPALGKQIRIESESYTIIGVLPSDFTGIELQRSDVWIPLAAVPSSHWIASGKGNWWTGTHSWALRVIRRAAVGTDAMFEQRATVAVREANRRLFPAKPDTEMTVIAGPILAARGPGKPGQDMIISTRLGGVAAIVLLIACANVINLLLARAAHRRREIAVRLAVGISRARLVRLLTAETMLLALVAGGAAVLAAWWGGGVLRSLILPDIVWEESALHWRVVVFTLAISLAAGVVAGIIPAWQSSRPDLTRALKDGAKDGSLHRSRLRNTMAIAQAALSVTLLVGAALFVRSLKNVEGLDLGYDADRLQFGWVETLPDAPIPGAVIGATMREIELRLSGRPGIESVARASLVPMNGISFLTFYWGADSSGSLERNFPTFSAVSRSYFEAVGMRIVRGTTFDDRAGSRDEVVLNEAMARLMFPGREAMGQCIRFEKRENPCYTVVGIAENARQGYVIEPEAKPQYYLPLGNMPLKGWAGRSLIVRSRPGAATTTANELRSERRRAFPRSEVIVRPMTEQLEPDYRPWRLGATLFTAFGLLALAVALVGIYSTVSYGVSRRTHEFGVRVALGARVADVLALVVGEGTRVVAVGIVVGIGLALASGRLVAALLYGVTPGDPIVIGAVAATILAVAVLATLVPAWRAARVDPVSALRME